MHILSEHPIAPAIRERILAELQSAEDIACINQLLARKMAAGEAERGPQWPQLNALIEAEFSRAAQHAVQQPAARAMQPLDQFLRDCVRRFEQARAGSQ